MTERIKLGISSCLLGNTVRYDGGHKRDHYLRDTLGRFVEWVPVCPEVECGLPVPREAMHLLDHPGAPRLVTRATGIDHTERMLAWAKKKLNELEKQELSGFVFKSRSPSSGMQGVKMYTKTGVSARKGIGIFAQAFMDHFPLLPVEDEGRLQDPGIRENFIARVFVYQRWSEFIAARGTLGHLVTFHAEHKLLLMSHSPKHLRELGLLVSQGKKYQRALLFENYFRVMMEGLRLAATTKKHTNVLQHMAGYFKKLLSSDEKQELLDVITQYRKGLVPLIVPITLIKHYVRKYDEAYLAKQYYLNPHPLELMLRNHV
jgi:uncharacterized protein YbgA (DUF1722 family)/uncharacterized protein YbbK (DUF523 family)